MKITRLSWAGLLIQSGNTNILIDPIQNITERMTGFLGNPKEPIFEIPGSIGNPHVFVTHVHPDHFDRELIEYLINDSTTFYAPAAAVEKGNSIGLAGVVPALYEPVLAGNLTVTAVPAVDWVGDEQVSWVIRDGDKQIFHGGDTMWHGYWWKFAKRFGAFDAVFLPVNGVTGNPPGIEPASEIPGTLTPKQAVTAARILGAKQLIPIHYGLFNNPPLYNEFPNVVDDLEREAVRQQVILHTMPAGGSIEI